MAWVAVVVICCFLRGCVALRLGLVAYVVWCCLWCGCSWLFWLFCVYLVVVSIIWLCVAGIVCLVDVV